MIIDAAMQLSSQQAVTVSAPSTNAMDLGALLRDLGKGQQARLAIQVNTAVAAAGAAAVQFQLQTADDAGFTTNVQTVVQTDAIPKASLTAGTIIELPLDRSDPYTARRYLRLYYVVGNGPLTAGIFTVAGALDMQDRQIYPVGWSVL